MILYINDRLNQWADWCAKGRRIEGLGYPSKVAFYRLNPIPNQVATPVPDEACWEIEQAVHRLDPNLRLVVNQFYLRAGTAASHAKALMVSRDTMYARLHRAHVKVMEWLQCGDIDEDLCPCPLTASDRFVIKQVS